MSQLSKISVVQESGWNWNAIGQRLKNSPQSAAQIFAEAGIHEASLRPLCAMAAAHEPYGRRVLFCSGDYEVMLATWTAGAECAAHNHGFSNGLVWLVNGHFVENHYHFDTSLELTETRVHSQTSSIVSVDHQDIHSMRAPHGGISLHIYHPPVHKMKVYDVANRRTLTVTDDCGAWIPFDHQQIVDVKSWPSQLDATT